MLSKEIKMVDELLLKEHTDLLSAETEWLKKLKINKERKPLTLEEELELNRIWHDVN